MDACFYWFDNNWHYYKKWEHLIEQKSLGKLPDELKVGLQANVKEFPESDAWISRTISCLIKGNWTASETQERADKMVANIQKVLKGSYTTL